MADGEWSRGDAYEAYVGRWRWSRLVAREFVPWLGVPAGRRWLDVGCGTGALTGAVLTAAQPVLVVGVDPSAGFLATARARMRAGSWSGAEPAPDARPGSHTGAPLGPPTDVLFCAADARALPLPPARFEASVSGLALNFVPDPARAVAELARVATPGGVVAAYVWDYAGGMELIRHFWDAAASLDPAAAALDEARRFPLCRPEPLAALWAGAGLTDVTVEPIDVTTDFATFEDYWRPFLGGQGPAPGYVASLTAEHRRALRELLRDRLAGRLRLTARAWAVRGDVGPPE
ncbi:methyltransferase domain-containing protein [Longispora sp. K20-0274]|uniref:class I SAM-dependent methyltransferase n=1 Tax=Longispora sp. K20-0274 TaxID=3088255 RepID=UPI0039996039